MPTPQEFMEKVVAWPGLDGPGFVNLHWKPPETKGHGFRGKPFKELHEFMDFAQYAAIKPGTYREIYFCLSTQAMTGKVIRGYTTAFRNAKQALLLKSIWIDIDVKPDQPDKAYVTLAEAMAALRAFVTQANLPPPSAIIYSGGGLHVYWISDKPLTVQEWRPYAEGLRAEILRLGLKCDAGLTTDEARVLRVPGTFNNKQNPPRAVRVAHLGDAISFASVLANLAAIVPLRKTLPVTAAVKPVLPFDITPFAGKPMAKLFYAEGFNPQADNLADGLSSYSDLPLSHKEIIPGCAHYRESAITQGKGQSQGLWMLTVLGTTWWENGRTYAHYFSKGYPTYDREETDKMYDRKVTERETQGLGWPSCSAFEGEGAKCKTCPFYGKIKSPLNLAERIVPSEASPVAVPPTELSLPDGYTVDPDTGCIAYIEQKELKNGTTVNNYLRLFYSEIRKPLPQKNPRRFTFETSLDIGGWGVVSILEEDLATEQRLMTLLRRQGVKPFGKNQRLIGDFMTAWMDKLDREKKRQQTMCFGWLRKEDGGEIPIGFAYAGKVSMNDNTIQEAGFSDIQLEADYTPKGSFEPFKRASKIITDKHQPQLEAIYAVGYAAPLMTFAGLYNSVMCPYGPSGGTKSFSIHTGAAIWGNPNKTIEKPLSSLKGIVRKLGFIKNLPCYWDEVVDEKKMDEVRGMISPASEGSDGHKLRTDRSFFDQQDWQTLLCVGANMSLMENILKHNSYTTAQLERIFEFHVPWLPGTMPRHEASQLINSLDYNYGHMGLQYREILGRDPQGIRDFVTKIQAKFDREVDHQTNERFRSAMASCVFAGAHLANTMGCEFHLEELWPWLKQQYMSQRHEIAAASVDSGSEANTLYHMGQFFKSIVKNVLVVADVPMKKRGRPAIAYISGPCAAHPGEIHMRVAQTARILDISKAELTKFVAKNNGSGSSVIKGLIKYFKAEAIEKIDLAAGATVIGGRETIIRVPVPPNSPFEGVLSTNTPMDQVQEQEEEPAGPVNMNLLVAQAAADLAIQGATGPHA